MKKPNNFTQQADLENSIAKADFIKSIFFMVICIILIFKSLYAVLFLPFSIYYFYEYIKYKTIHKLTLKQPRLDVEVRIIVEDGRSRYALYAEVDFPWGKKWIPFGMFANAGAGYYFPCRPESLRHKHIIEDTLEYYKVYKGIKTIEI